MYWNYRIVNVPSENGGEDWFALKEVYYNEETDEPVAYGEPCTGSETHEDVLEVFKNIALATTLPPLHESDVKEMEGAGVKRKHLEALICEVSEEIGSGITPELLRKVDLSKDRLLDFLYGQLHCRMMDKRIAARRAEEKVSADHDHRVREHP